MYRAINILKNESRMWRKENKKTNGHLTIKTMTVPNRHLDLINVLLIILMTDRLWPQLLMENAIL